ncbi:transmembrane protein, putative, partial [Bodo saltans]
SRAAFHFYILFGCVFFFLIYFACLSSTPQEKAQRAPQRAPTTACRVRMRPPGGDPLTHMASWYTNDGRTTMSLVVTRFAARTRTGCGRHLPRTRADLSASAAAERGVLTHFAYYATFLPSLRIFPAPDLPPLPRHPEKQHERKNERKKMARRSFTVLKKRERCDRSWQAKKEEKGKRVPACVFDGAYNCRVGAKGCASSATAYGLHKNFGSSKTIRASVEL